MDPRTLTRTATAEADPGERVLMLAAGAKATAEPTARALADSDLSVRMIGDVDELVGEISRGFGALFVAAGTLGGPQLEQLLQALAERSELARLPVFLVGDGSSRHQKQVAALAALDNVTLLEMPPSERTIVAAARAALRERQRQTYVGQLLDRIEEAEQREERLLATVGHELRNPLGVIATALSLMRRMEGDEGPTKRYRGMIERQVESLTRKIDEMLDPDRTPQGAPQLREWPPVPHGRGSGRRDAPSAAARGTSLLVVEDNDDARTAMVELLELWGFDVHGAATGEEATELASQHDPKIALVDLDLPGIDGYEVARRLRQASRDRLLIAMSGYGQPEDRDRSFAAGFDRHLIKPVDPRRLAHLLEKSRTAQGAA